MSRLTLLTLIVIFFATMSTSYSQSGIQCDNGDLLKKITFTETEINGEIQYINLYGDIVKPHPVYELSLEERVKKGYTVVDPDKNSRTARPTYTLTFLDTVDNTGIGFDDPSLGSIRRQILESALTDILTMITNTGFVDIQVNASENEGKGALASAGPYPTPASTGYSIGSVAKHVILGKDPYPTFPDAEITFDFGYNWNNSTDYPDFDEYDMYSVALHELVHCFGFTSYLAPDGTSVVGEDGYYTLFDQFLINSDYTNLLEGDPPGLSTETGDLTSNALRFQFSTGSIAPVYSPSPYTYGSSCSHLDHGRSSGVTYVMHPSISTGTTGRILHADEINVLSSLGYGIESQYLYTGLSDLTPSNLENIQIYPNPATNYIKLIWNKTINHNALTIKINNIIGKEVFNSNRDEIFLRNNYVIIDTNSLPNGIYFVVIDDKESTVTKRIIKK
ncbi:MAG: hypothetical protein COC01_06955 [Bacteroidetes bacterium]|nr:T9SS type A sorting domain-containing protein [Bacteroidia bacterium]PCH66908.1 MAG: hypothetical protein COC01_06955 [Bacteroidota bacterium]